MVESGSVTYTICIVALAAWFALVRFRVTQCRHRNAKAAWRDMRVTESLVEAVLELGFRARLRNELETITTPDYLFRPWGGGSTIGSGVVVTHPDGSTSRWP